MDGQRGRGVRGALTSPVRTVFYETIDSTNTEARRRAEDGEPGPLWIAAERQSAGKGRRGRDWESPSGNLAATLLISVGCSAAEAAQLSFCAALAVADLLSDYAGDAAVKVKWPNDVMIGDAKASGILLESGRAGDGLWVAIGIGVNLAHPPKVSERPATCLAAHMTAPPPSPETALEQLAELMAHWMGLWDRMGLAPIAAAWTERAYGLGQAATARLPNESLEGTAEGLDADGSLLLRLGDGTLRRISAGDVFFERAP